MLTWAAAWRGEKHIKDGDLLRDGKRAMLKRLHDLFNEADAVVTWNGDDFDLKILNKEWMLLRLPPPRPYKSLDLIRTSRGKFRFTSNKLDFVAAQIKTHRKQKNRGHELWLDCMARKRKAFAEMRRYNRGDIRPLINIYERFRPWMTTHPNVNMYHGGYDRPKCTYCGHAHVLVVKARRTQQGTKRQWQCQSAKCGGYFTVAPKPPKPPAKVSA